MASTTLMQILFVTLLCFSTTVFSQEGSGDGGSGTDSMFDVTDVVTELVTDEIGTDTTSSSGTPSASDIQAYDLVISNEFTTFDLEVDNIVTYNVTIRNPGGTAIAASSGSNNFNITVIVSDNEDPTSNDATTMSIVPELSMATNLNSGIAAGGSIVIETVNVIININSEECATYENGYTCVQIARGPGGSYTDSDSTNNYYCISFGVVAEGYGGVLTCSGCAAQISLLLMLLSSLVVYFTSL